MTDDHTKVRVARDAAAERKRGNDELTRRRRAEPYEVIQCDPTASLWGPIFVVVEEIYEHDVLGFVVIPEEVPKLAYVRVRHSDYVVIGHAEWRAVGRVE